MKKIISLLAFLLFSVSCSGLDDLISDLEDYEYEEGYECAPGDAILPSGTYPDYLIGSWRCQGGGADSIRFDSDGTFSATLSTTAYRESRDYFSECFGCASREETGEWVITGNRLCLKNDNVQPGFYNCQGLTYRSGTVRGSTCVSYYKDGDYLGRECDIDGRLGTCTLDEE